MKTMLVREHYKVVQVLETAPHYWCAQVVDIADRERPTRLLNLYHGTLAGQYAAIYATMPQNAAYYGSFLVENGLAAVFVSTSGQPIEKQFCRGASWDWRARIDCADKLLQLALNMADWPLEISYAAWQSNNVYIDTNRNISLRFAVRPFRCTGAETLPEQVGRLLQKIFPPRFAQGDAEAAFCARLRAEPFQSIVPLYAAWKQAAQQMAQEYQAWEQQPLFKQWGIQVWKQLKRTKNRG